VVTNIDADHMETYGGDFSRLRATFLEFLHHLPFYGLAVMCVDDPVVRAAIAEVTRPVLTYGLSDIADVYATDLRRDRMRTHFSVHRAGTDHTLEVELNLPGRHNVLNALAAIAVAQEVGVSDDAIVRGLANFKGVGRRLQEQGEIHGKHGRALLIDDYGHHPREVAAVLEAIRNAFPGKRLVLCFQPHRYTRTRDLFEDFAITLSQVDILLLLEVYAAGEAPIANADGRTLCRAIRARGHVDPIFVEHLDELAPTLHDLIRDDDVVLTLGAGDIGAASAKLVSLLMGASQ
jgi:UDP-N-acetylmuramate--alanine ligase